MGIYVGSGAQNNATEQSGGNLLENRYEQYSIINPEPETAHLPKRSLQNRDLEIKE